MVDAVCPSAKPKLYTMPIHLDTRRSPFQAILRGAESYWCWLARWESVSQILKDCFSIRPASACGVASLETSQINVMLSKDLFDSPVRCVAPIVTGSKEGVAVVVH